MPSFMSALRKLVGGESQSPGQSIGPSLGGVSQDVVQQDSPIFTANPKDYILKNPCVLRDGFQDSASIFNELSMGPRAIGYIERPEAKTTARIVNGPVYRTLKNIKAMPATGPFDREFYYLPWSEDKCTFGHVSKSAEFLLTGPLSGCNVYLVRNGSHPPILFHANANKDSAHVPTNNAVKDHDVAGVLQVLGGRIVARLARGEYQIPAFVWGHRTGESWAIYVHEADPFTNVFTNKKIYEG